MLLLGICNPAGEGATYNGLYYKQDELASMVADGRLHDVPVKQEHSGGDVGRVVSSFVRSDGALQCVMEVDDSTVEGSIAAGFVRDGIAADLSLGYSVDVRHSGAHASAPQRLQAGAKKVLEISLVRRGARRGCHVLAYQDSGRQTVYTAPAPAPAGQCAWQTFDMY